MEELPREWRKCFICSTDTDCYLQNIYTLLTKQTNTPVYILLERITGMEILEVEMDEGKSTVICQDCFVKINDYDDALKTVQKLEKEFISLLNRTNNVEMLEEMNDEKPQHCLPDKLITGISAASDQQKRHDRPRNFSTSKEEAVERVKITENKSVHQKELKLEDIEEIYSMGLGSKIIISQVIQEEGKPTRESNRLRELKKSQVPVTILPVSSYKSTAVRSKTSRKQLLSYKCSKCSKKFLARSEYKLHLASHNQEDDCKVICYICGATYKSKSALVIHMGIHNGVSPFECGICQKKFTQKGALVRHMPIHTGVKPYQCDKCGKQFIHYSSFHMHQLSHDDIRTKKCSICGLELRSNSHLNRHMRVHSGEKPHACPICDQKFAQRYNMTSHYKTHLGIHRKYTKSFSCKICAAIFRYKKKLSDHMLEFHGVVEEASVEASVSHELHPFIQKVVPSIKVENI